MSYNNWKEERVAIADLLVDPFNPRYPEPKVGKSQGDIIKYIAEKYKAIEVARGIAQLGYFPTEVLIAYPEHKELFVIEGNRRLTACKLLLNPDLAPTRQIAEFKKLSQQAELDSIKTLKVVISPSREEAIPIILYRHNVNSVLAWETLSQIRYYLDLLNSGSTFEDIINNYGINRAKLREAIILDKLHNKATELDLSVAEKEKLAQPDFPITTLQRYTISTKNWRNYFGISYEENGDLSISIDDETFSKRYERLIKDIVSGESTSRNSNEKYKDYTKPAGPEKKRRNKNVLFTRDAFSYEKDDRISEIISELTQVNLKYPNSVAMLLRLLIELSTYQFLNQSGELARWRKEYNENVSKTWPKLSEMIQRIVNENLLSDPQVTRSIKMLTERGHKKVPLIDELNSFVHNASYRPDQEMLRNSFLDLKSYLEEVLKGQDGGKTV